VEADEGGESPLRPLLDWLDYNGFSVATKPVRLMLDAEGRRHPQGDMRFEMAVDAMEMAASVDHLVLVAGHDSFARLVAALRRGGKRVTVLSTMNGTRTLVSDALRRQADHFVDVADLQASIALVGKDHIGERDAADEHGSKEAKGTVVEQATAADSSSTSTAGAAPPIAVVVERRTRTRRARTAD
jgi:hypothetical protein